MHKENLLEELKYIDGITIIDTSGTILFTVKFNPRFVSEIEESDEIVGTNLFSAFPILNEKNSTLYKAMKNGQPIFRKSQEIIDFKGHQIETTNVTLPIKSHGKIIGAIELSKDISKQEGLLENLIEMDAKLFIPDKRSKGTVEPERARYTLDDIITTNKKMIELKKLAEKTARGTSPVFIYGETGTGKEMFAHALHNASNRADKPFIAQNCAAIPESLMESILFGTKKGSFTGAEDNPGLFELADGGTIFLDELNSMPIALQSKLLRVLQDGLIRRLGDKHVRKVDVRIIAAANKHPRVCVKEGLLRMDLFYRLCVMPFDLLPLRERKDDIKLLLPYFINKYNHEHGKRIRHVSKEAYDFLMAYTWPGNVREFEHVVEFVVNQVDDEEETLTLSDVEKITRHLWDDSDVEEFEVGPLKQAIEKVEKQLIAVAIEKTKGNVSQAATILQIPRQTLQNKLKMYRLK